MRLYHFSDRGDIDRFEPRPVTLPAQRRPGHEWLNGPLVWAIDENHQSMYLFPRDCPRILLWATETTTPADRAAWLRRGEHRMVACIERAWFDRFRDARLYRYLLPSEPFESLGDAGMWVARDAVAPLESVILDDLAVALAAAGTELRVMDSLAPLRAAQASSLHVSTIRLRNSTTWNDEGG